MKSLLHQQQVILNLNLKCSQHKFNESEFLYLKPDSKNVFICSRCVFESNGKIQQSDCVELKTISEANAQTILSQYPPLSSSELNQKVLRFSSSIEGEIKQIKEYYQKLIRGYETAVKKAMQKAKAEIDKLQQLRESFIKKYAEISQIENLKQLIAQSQQDSNSDTKLRSFISTKSKEADENTKKISSQLLELQQYKETFSAEQPERQIANILSEIEKISFFSKAAKTSDSFIIPNQNPERRSIINSINIEPDSTYVVAQIEKIQSQIHIQKTDQSIVETHFKEVFQPKKNYIITIKTIVGDKIEPNPNFYFGIQGSNSTRQIKYQEIDNQYGSISKMLKGKQLHLGKNYQTKNQNYWRLNGERRFEVRFNQENRILRVGSLPGYSLVAEIENRIDIDLFCEYKFVLGMGSFGKGNRIIVEEVCEIDSFDDRMDRQESQNCLLNLFKRKPAHFDL